ncbi:MAG: CPBP family intramembrane metalloprotease [Gammaproteobacteria bacterium]|nr:CPBP family intramembrane metalloprotease [Gammaproteobacteria bacterium]
MPRLNIKFLWIIITSVILVMLLYYVVNPFHNINHLDKLRYLSVSAGRMMDRHMHFYEGYTQVPALERSLYEFLFGPKHQVEQDAIDSFREVLQHLGKADDDTRHVEQLNIKARLCITIAEKRSRAELIEALKLFNNDPEEEVVAAALRFAYLDKDAGEFSAEIYTGVNLLPLGWAANRLRYQIALKTGHDRQARTILEQLEANGAKYRRFVLQMVIIVGLIITLGLFLVFRLRILHEGIPWHHGVLDGPWPFIDGLAVTISAALCGLIITLLLHVIPHNPFFTPNLITSWSTLFASLPMIVLIYRYLLKPHGWNYRRAFGLRRPEAGWLALFTTTGALMALDWLGQVVIGWGTWQLGVGNHWSEGMQERLVFGPTQTVLLSTINIVVWAAVFEEIGFRGLVYTTLRQRLTPTTAIVISALLFSALHLYSVAGFLSVFWSGLILAYAYERYHSLLPGILIHAAGNLLSLGPVLLFYR